MSTWVCGCAGVCRKQEDAWFGGAQGLGSSERDHRAGGLHSQQVSEERKKKRCH